MAQSGKILRGSPRQSLLLSLGDVAALQHRARIKLWLEDEITPRHAVINSMERRDDTGEYWLIKGQFVYLGGTSAGSFEAYYHTDSSTGQMIVTRSH